MTPTAAIGELGPWMLRQGLIGGDIGVLVDGFCDGLSGAGVQLWRGHVAIATLHPSYSALGYTWRHDRGLLAEQYQHRNEPFDLWLRSPLRLMVEERAPRKRFDLERGEGFAAHSILAEFHAEGATDWFGTLVEFGGADHPAGMPGMACSWVSDRPGGFTAEELAVIEQLLPSLALAAYRIVLTEVATTLLQTYTGDDAGRRILSGQVRRGAVERITAVLCIADIRGFTKLADTTQGELLLGWLNECLGVITDAIEAHDGQVLKFLGDGLLAVFRLDGRPPTEVCAAALAAAERALSACAALDTARASAGSPALVVDLALHLGEVLYGNIGSARRLDFTVIGPAVNEASRIEALCEPLGRQLLMSSTFARAYAGATLSLGPHRLRGVEMPQELFTVA